MSQADQPTRMENNKELVRRQAETLKALKESYKMSNEALELIYIMLSATYLSGASDGVKRIEAKMIEFLKIKK